MIHALGDVPSPIIIGTVSDSSNNPFLTMLLATCWLIWTVLFWAAAAIVSKTEIPTNQYSSLTEPIIDQSDRVGSVNM